MLLTVIIPAYNVERYIRKAVESALRISSIDCEVIVINDGSTDGTRAVLSDIHDKRLIIHDKPNGGLPAARNTGLSIAKGKYIYGLDGDDIAVPSGVVALVARMEEVPDALFAYGAYRQFEDGVEDFARTVPLIRRWKPSGEIFKKVVCGNFIQPGTVVVRRDALKEIGGHNEILTIGEDWDVWCRLAARGRAEFVPKLCVGYRQRPESMTNQPNAMKYIENYSVAVQSIFSDPAVVHRLNGAWDKYRKFAVAHSYFAAAVLLNSKGARAESLRYLALAVMGDLHKSLFFLSVYAVRFKRKRRGNGS